MTSDQEINGNGIYGGGGGGGYDMAPGDTTVQTPDTLLTDIPIDTSYSSVIPLEQEAPITDQLVSEGLMTADQQTRYLAGGYGNLPLTQADIDAVRAGDISMSDLLGDTQTAAPFTSPQTTSQPGKSAGTSGGGISGGGGSSGGKSSPQQQPKPGFPQGLFPMLPGYTGRSAALPQSTATIILLIAVIAALVVGFLMKR